MLLFKYYRRRRTEFKKPTEMAEQPLSLATIVTKEIYLEHKTQPMVKR